MGTATLDEVRVFSRKTIHEFTVKHADADQPLRAWFAETEQADWKSPADIKARYASASFVGSDRVVFNIKGNTYRLIVQIKYDFKCVYIRFIGTHAEYDTVDAATV